MRDQVGAARATSWDNLWGGLRSARNALNSSHTGRKPRPPLWAATIRDTPDRAVSIVADEKSAVMRHSYADGACPHRGVVHDEPGHEVLIFAGRHPVL